MQGESSRGGSREDSRSPVSALVPVNPDVVVRASVASKPGLFDVVVTYRRKRDETQTPTTRELRVGTTARPPGAAAEAPMAPMVVSEAPTPTSVASHPDWEVERQYGDDPRNMLDSNSPGQIEGMDKGSLLAKPSSENTSVSSNPFHRPQWKVIN